MPKFVKELLLGLGKALVAIVIVFGLFIGYAAYSEHSASTKVEDFCRVITPGSETSVLLDLAISRGADPVHTKWFQLDDQDQLSVTFPGATPLSRHICWVKAVQGRVVSSQVVYLD